MRRTMQQPRCSTQYPAVISDQLVQLVGIPQSPSTARQWFNA